MSNWKYTNATNTTVTRINEDGSIESCLATELLPDIIPDPADEPTIEDQKAKLQSQIEEIERVTMVPRVTREFMITFAKLEAQRQVEKYAAEGITATVEEILEANIGYKRVQAVEDQIEALRDQIRAL
jgi:hypothetical protein